MTRKKADPPPSRVPRGHTVHLKQTTGLKLEMTLVGPCTIEILPTKPEKR